MDKVINHARENGMQITILYKTENKQHHHTWWPCQTTNDEIKNQVVMMFGENNDYNKASINEVENETAKQIIKGRSLIFKTAATPLACRTYRI
jgi:hypothetical protein